MCETSEVKRYELSNKSCKMRFTATDYNTNLKKNAKKSKKKKTKQIYQNFCPNNKTIANERQ